MFDGTPRIATIREIEQFYRNIDDMNLEKLFADSWAVLVERDS